MIWNKLLKSIYCSSVSGLLENVSSLSTRFADIHTDLLRWYFVFPLWWAYQLKRTKVCWAHELIIRNSQQGTLLGDKLLAVGVAFQHCCATSLQGRHGVARKCCHETWRHMWNYSKFCRVINFPKNEKLCSRNMKSPRILKELKVIHICLSLGLVLLYFEIVSASRQGI